MHTNCGDPTVWVRQIVVPDDDPRLLLFFPLPSSCSSCTNSVSCPGKSNFPSLTASTAKCERTGFGTEVQKTYGCSCSTLCCALSEHVVLFPAPLFLLKVDRVSVFDGSSALTAWTSLFVLEHIFWGGTTVDGPRNQVRVGKSAVLLIEARPYICLSDPPRRILHWAELRGRSKAHRGLIRTDAA